MIAKKRALDIDAVNQAVRRLRLRRDSPGFLRRISPGLLRRISPGLLRRISPGLLRRISPGLLRRISPGLLRRADCMRGAVSECFEMGCIASRGGGR
jgi:hypothetical protein